jgi:hypothetical protein
MSVGDCAFTRPRLTISSTTNALDEFGARRRLSRGQATVASSTPLPRYRQQFELRRDQHLIDCTATEYGLHQGPISANALGERCICRSRICGDA